LKDKEVRIGFIGAGAIGSLFGGYLASANLENYKQSVIFFGRANHIDAINKKGLTLQTDNGALTINTIMAFDNYITYKNAYPSEESEKFDYLFISTKAHNTLKAIKEYKAIVKSSKWVILLQNGIGNEAGVEKEVGKEKLVRILTSHGALLKEPGWVVHTGVGFTKMGCVFPKGDEKSTSQSNSKKLTLNNLKEFLDNVMIETEIVDDIIRHSWEKAFVNIGINALGAITRLKNGELLKFNSLNHYMIILVEEAIKVAQAYGYKFQKEKYVDLMFTVAKETSNNENSMLQDIKRKKPTEINFLNGKIVDFADKLKMDVPFNRIITDLVRSLEYSYSCKN
jgi:2-dehydropantoate 2-reductase